MNTKSTKPDLAHIYPWWMAYFFDNPMRKIFQSPERILGPYLKPGMAVMDLGCGMGFFSIAMARMVGSAGRVVSVDLDNKRLEVMLMRARRAGVADRIKPIKCRDDDIVAEDLVDFALAMWMVHEAARPDLLFGQARDRLNEGGALLFAEPKVHVSAHDFKALLSQAESAGLVVHERPSVGLSHAVLLRPSRRRAD